ncbi:LADA_0C12948g1_1 [Lachancea dasiensis]|uniref:LADA_0C12948g1_1 n=1 Tax=Lachancea dasiensis TaxID=1072105 RepID=A0A1G4J221_9SACH|nr:LADA_0C12948g1_1 [Lachancea dasiensis]
MPGLKVQVLDSSDVLLSNAQSLIDFNPKAYPDVQVVYAQNLDIALSDTVQIDGYFTPKTNGSYTFYLDATDSIFLIGDGAAFACDNSQVFEAHISKIAIDTVGTSRLPRLLRRATTSFTTTLSAGRSYPIRIVSSGLRSDSGILSYEGPGVTRTTDFTGVASSYVDSQSSGSTVSGVVATVSGTTAGTEGWSGSLTSTSTSATYFTGSDGKTTESDNYYLLTPTSGSATSGSSTSGSSTSGPATSGSASSGSTVSGVVATVSGTTAGTEGWSGSLTSTSTSATYITGSDGKATESDNYYLLTPSSGSASSGSATSGSATSVSASGSTVSGAVTTVSGTTAGTEGWSGSLTSTSTSATYFTGSDGKTTESDNYYLLTPTSGSASGSASGSSGAITTSASGVVPKVSGTTAGTVTLSGSISEPKVTTTLGDNQMPIGISEGTMASVSSTVDTVIAPVATGATGGAGKVSTAIQSDNSASSMPTSDLKPTTVISTNVASSMSTETVTTYLSTHTTLAVSTFEGGASRLKLGLLFALPLALL